MKEKSYAVLHLILAYDYKPDSKGQWRHKEVKKVETVLCKTLQQAEKILNDGFKKTARLFDKIYGDDLHDYNIAIERDSDRWVLVQGEDDKAGIKRYLKNEYDGCSYEEYMC